ncbi:MAG: cupredoxin family copper-binding protein [Streptomyces sp.]|nr:cupredoxin family copper-binding protein [Streptomyces sp.]
MTDEQGRAAAVPPPRPRNRTLLLVGVGAALAAVACLVTLSSAGASQAPARTSSVADVQPAAPAAAKAAAKAVAMKNYAFSPAALTIPVGTTVTWTNEDTAPHNVTTTSGPVKLASGNMDKGASWSFTFTKAGTYKYYCSVHPDMTAQITVVADSGGSSGGSGSGGTSGGTGTGGSTSGGSTSGGTTGSSTSGGSTASGGSTTGGSTSGSMGGMSSGTTSGGSTSGGTSGSGGSTGGGGGTECYDVQQVLLPILQHLDSAHLEESPGQQVQDALDLDSYVKRHTVWVESILTPLVDGTTATADQTLTVLLQHLMSAHLEESLGQQVQDILNPDAYVKTHTVWAEHLLQPAEDYLTANC